MRILPFRFDATEMWVFRELIRTYFISKGNEAALQDDVISQSGNFCSCYVFLTCKKYELCFVCGLALGNAYE